MNKGLLFQISVMLVVLSACMPAQTPTPAKLPSLAYSDWAKQQESQAQIAHQNGLLTAQLHDAATSSAARAQLKMVSDSWQDKNIPIVNQANDVVSNEDIDLPSDVEYRPSLQATRPYEGPLALGNPGISSSLWQETQRGGDLLRDDRAWQPMDLITIIITENAEGAKEGDTEIKGKSTVVATIGKWLGLVESARKRNPQMVDENGNMISASTQNNYKGEGETTRKDTLKAKISAMVVEVLPGNILRIEGEKIIALNQEEQTIAISGLVRPRDINSNNEVDSSKIANLRVDYYGRGVVSEAQYGGWFSRLMRVLWPF